MKFLVNRKLSTRIGIITTVITLGGCVRQYFIHSQK